MQILYRKNKLGVGSWRIWNEGALIYIAHSTTNGGSEVIHTELVPAGLAGRTLEEQVASRIHSRVKKQKDRGYVESIEEAISKPLTNMLDLPPSMLAKKLDQMKTWRGAYIMQPKLDGFRCMISRVEDKVTAYTRGGIELTAISHIVEAIGKALPEGMVLDGEIYEHRTPLQTIASLAKRKQPGTERLVYHVYDSVSSDPFEARYSDAYDVVINANSKHITAVENHRIATKDQMWELFQEFREDGYEGGILRDLIMPYESGTRSSGLIKVKAREDADFRVIDVVPGSDGNGILVCQMPSGQIFKTLAPGDHTQKKFILIHKDSYIGRKVTVEYANLTNDGIPFHSVATRFVEEFK